MKTVAVLTDKRNYGIDLLRIVSMLYVIILHVIGHGGLGVAATNSFAQTLTVGFLRSWSFCAVNIFGIISGYIGYTDEKKKPNYANFFVLWAQVVFYCAMITVLFRFWNSDWVTWQSFFQMFFPLTNNLYWYFTAYAALFFLMPFLNAGVRNSSHCHMSGLLIVIFLLFSCFDSITNYFISGKGYCFTWLMILYLTGAILRKNNIGKTFHPAVPFIGIVLCCLLSTFLFIRKFEFNIFNIKVNDSLLSSYKFPAYYLTAIFYVIWFSKLSFGQTTKKIISFAAPGAFTVYLLNTHPLVWKHVMSERFLYLADGSVIKILVHVLGFACLFVAGSILIDFFRQKLFSFFRIQKIIDAAITPVKKALIRLTSFL